MSDTRKPSWTPLIVGVILALGAAVALGIYFVQSRPVDRAAQACEDAIRDETGGEPSDVDVSVDGDEFRVRGYVTVDGDRHRFGCTVTNVDGWTVVDQFVW